MSDLRAINLYEERNGKLRLAGAVMVERDFYRELSQHRWYRCWSERTQRYQIVRLTRTQRGQPKMIYLKDEIQRLSELCGEE